MTDTNLNQRAAAQMAADAAKTLIAISVAAGGVTLAYYQFLKGSESDSKLATILILVATALFVTSMISGMSAISTIYKSGEGRSPPSNAPNWSTADAKIPLNIQAWSGLLGLACFGISVYFGVGSPQVKWSIDAPGQNLAHALIGKKIQIYGTWDELYIRDQHQNWIRLDKVPPGEQRFISIGAK